MFLIYFVILGISVAVWHHIKYRHRNQLLSKFPSPPNKLPVLHNSLTFLGKSQEDMFNTAVNLSWNLGPLYYFTLGPFDNGTFIIRDTKIAEEVLSSQKWIEKGEIYDLMRPWLGDGLVMSAGKKWFQRRKILTPTFHFQILEKFVETMNEQGDIMIEKLKKLNGAETDVVPLFNLFALDVICESAMGCKINAQNSDNEYVKAVHEVTGVIARRFFDVVLKNKFIYFFTETYRREQENLKTLHDFTNSVIKARRAELMNADGSENSVDDVGSKKRMALLELLLKATIDGQPLSDQDIREEVDTFMFAGHDTTTSGLSFCLYLLAKNPKIQQKAYESIQTEIGDEEDLSLKVLNQLHYLELVIKESLRIFPPVPFFARRLQQETEIAGFTFPKGCNLHFGTFLMGRDPKIFPNPLEFKPERFDVEQNTQKINPYAFVPFSAGPRNCIGQKFALFEMKSVLCKILRNFEVTINDNHEELQICQTIVLTSLNGVKLKLKSRK